MEGNAPPKLGSPIEIEETEEILEFNPKGFSVKISIF